MTFQNLRVPFKLAAAFSVVLVAIVAMGAVLFVNLRALEKADVATEKAHDTLAAVEDAKFALARQENSLRGYLLSGDDYYAKRIAQKHRPRFEARVADLTKLAGSDKDALARIDKLNATFADWRDHAEEPAVKLGADPATRADGAAMVRHDGIADKLMDPLEAVLEDINDDAKASLTSEMANKARASATMKLALGLGILATAAIAAAMGFLLSKGIATPVTALTAVMRRLAAGDNSVQPAGAGRKDEIGLMAATVVTFREAAVAKVRLEAEAAASQAAVEAERAQNEEGRRAAAEAQKQVVMAVGNGLERLAAGDLTCRLDRAFPADYEKLRADFNGALETLEAAMGVVSGATHALRAGTGEIAQASDNLSRRTEQQAASLEETAAALDELTATVKRAASRAGLASDMVTGAKKDAQMSGEVVREAITAMDQIEKSSGEITQIIGVIDEIAFQTNLLALNAGVEAARAGEAGRGFAVVASEVRALAQRSADAAKQIKTLIASSSNSVSQGVALVSRTGEALSAIITKVAEIDGLISEISVSAQEQSTGLAQVNTAVNQMDQATQQNAAMVEESTAAVHSLSHETDELSTHVGRFRVAGDAGHQQRRVA